jgi:hypothetical protein
VGWYRFYFADERWEWSSEVEQIHGYQPGEITTSYFPPSDRQPRPSYWFAGRAAATDHCSSFSPTG